ncbi:MAG: hypothetical protein JW983_04860 [Elusimicrobia bacterium]|nr:hypothetical protein [Elusimicrobiota bacterium]
MKKKLGLSDTYKVGLFFIVTGLFFAVETFFKVNLLHKMWPALITVLGAGFINIFFIGKKKNATFLWIGSYFVLFSLLAFYCNFSSWGSLANLWPLFISFTGLSFLLIFLFNLKNKIYLFTGLILLSVSIVFFIVFSLSAKYWWLICIFIGISILLTGRDSEKQI